MKRTLLLLLTIVAAAVFPLSAHHSFAVDYFEDQTVTIQGELVQFEYKNPHSWVYIMAPDANGEMQRFGAEWANSSRLRQMGIMPDTFKSGDQVIITGSPGRRVEEHRIHLRRIERPSDGLVVGGNRGRGAPPAGGPGRGR